MNTLSTDVANIIYDYTTQLNKNDVHEELQTICLECRKYHEKKIHSCYKCDMSFCTVKKVNIPFCPPYYAGVCPHCDEFNFLFHEGYSNDDYVIPRLN